MVVDPADRPGDGRWFLDTWMKALCGGDSTGGSLSMIEWRGGRGFSPPLFAALAAGYACDIVGPPME